jgi:hypothetical protein
MSLKWICLEHIMINKNKFIFTCFGCYFEQNSMMVFMLVLLVLYLEVLLILGGAASYCLKI